MLKAGMLVKLKNIPGDYRGRIREIKDGAIYFKPPHSDGAYVLASYIPDLEDKQTQELLKE